jgi:hypothetical protein
LLKILVRFAANVFCSNDSIILEIIEKFFYYFHIIIIIVVFKCCPHLNTPWFILIFLDNLILPFHITLVEHWRMLVRSITSLYGENAGRIWQLVNEKTSADEQTIKQSTMMNKENFHAAVGWLAREDKIKRTGDVYSLDSTNLSQDIGSVAGRVWKILDIWEEADLQTLKKLADMSDEEVYAGLGWLAREGKIDKTEQDRYYLK